ncbi:MAG TPA: N-acetyltransferase [Verrucomicrobiales bacterium]|nr:N-acetyltransferase [Verrucomicrobiales bacterium]
MDTLARRSTLDEIVLWRDMFRLEMACQIIHDSIHVRPGWTEEYLLSVDGIPVGYGSVAIAGPWKGKPTVYEFYVAPHGRLHLFGLFQALLDASRATAIEVQSNDVQATAMLHAFSREVASESILFHDQVTTCHRPGGARFRHPTAKESPDTSKDQLRWRGVLEVEGQVVATGGILFHYNRPYGDIYMETKEAFRRRGFGSFLVQELKRVCYEGGHVPGARCNRDNVASRHTLQRAGFVPCGHILIGAVVRASKPRARRK